MPCSLYNRLGPRLSSNSELCLSEVPDITPMWHHYADAYKGVVLEFRAEPSVDSALQLARPVIYQDDPPHIASPHAWAKTIIATNGSELHELFRESQYIKTLSWSYEREWRVVSLARAGDTGLFADRAFTLRQATK